MKKAVFFDIDGTILDAHNGKIEMSEAVAKAIRDLQAAGNKVFIATGRPYAFINQKLSDFGFDGFVLSNGAHVMIDGKDIHMARWDTEFVKEIARQLNDYHIEYILEGERESYIHQNSDKFFNFCKGFNIAEQLVTTEYDLDKINIFKLELLCTDKETEKKCVQLFEKYPEYGCYYSINAALFEMYHKSSNKAKGIQKALEFLKIPQKDSYAFGDGMNDIEMLEYVGCGIAMGNASDEVKKHADKVTDTVANDGVAKAIYQYILK